MATKGLGSNCDEEERAQVTLIECAANDTQLNAQMAGAEEDVEPKGLDAAAVRRRERNLPSESVWQFAL